MQRGPGDRIYTKEDSLKLPIGWFPESLYNRVMIASYLTMITILTDHSGLLFSLYLLSMHIIIILTPASTVTAATGRSSSIQSQSSYHIPRPHTKNGVYSYLYDGRRGRPVFKPLRTPPSPPPVIPRSRNNHPDRPITVVNTVNRTANSEYF